MSTLSTVQHITAPIYVLLYARILSATLHSILYSVPLIRPRLPRFIELPSFSPALLPAPFFPSRPVLLFYADPLYTIRIYFTVCRKISHPLPSVCLSLPPPSSSPNERLLYPSDINVIKVSELVVACTEL